MKKTIFVISIVLLIVLPMYARSILGARRALMAAESARSAGRLEEAVVNLRRAISWNSPGNAYSKNAVVVLRTIAFEPANSPELRISALSGLVRGLRSSRNILQPSSNQDALLLEVQAELDKLSASTAESRIARLKPVPEPNYGYQLAAQFAFWSWIGAVLWTIFSGFNPDGSIRRSELSRALSVSMLLYVAWIVALTQA